MLKVIVSPLFWILGTLTAGCILYGYGNGKNNRWLCRAAFVLVSVATMTLYLLSLPPVANGLVRWLESEYPQPADAQMDSLQMIVVLGGGVYKEGAGKLSSSSYARVLHGVEVFRKSKAERLVMSGGTDRPDSPVVSEVMKTMALTLGVPEQSILVEYRSKNTEQHPKELLHLTGMAGRTLPIGLVTSAWHIPRAMASFSRYFDHVIPLPCDSAGRDIQFGAILLLPSVDALSESTTVIQELAGIMWYKTKWVISGNVHSKIPIPSP